MNIGGIGRIRAAPGPLERSVDELRQAHGAWTVTTEFLADDGSVAQTVQGSYRFNWVIEDRVLRGPVEWVRGEPPRVSGMFEVRTQGEGAAAEGTARQGGACLVADLVPFGIGRAHCATNADCNGPDAIDKPGHPGLADYHGYCAARDGSAEAPRCWTRPGPASTHCRRTADGLRLTPGVHAVGPVDADPLGRGEPRLRWAVYACLAHEGHDRACAESVSPHRQVSLTPMPSDANENY